MKYLQGDKLFVQISHSIPYYLDHDLEEPSGIGPLLRVKSKKHQLKKKLKLFIEDCNQAFEFRNTKNDEEAIKIWRKIFDEKFG